MAECMCNLINKKGTIIIEVQYLMNTLKDLTFDNIYHEHYNYWSLISLINFFKKFELKIFRAEKNKYSWRFIKNLSKKNNNIKIESSVKKLIKEEENFGIKNFQVYKDFGKKVYKIRENVLKNINKLKMKNKNIIGYGAPAKATTALNFFGITNQIDYIIEDNSLKHNKLIPGVKIPIKSKKNILKNNPIVIVLAWNFSKILKKIIKI